MHADASAGGRIETQNKAALLQDVGVSILPAAALFEHIYTECLDFLLCLQMLQLVEELGQSPW